VLDRNIAREGTAPEFGRSLNGFGINLLVREIGRTTAFLKEVFGMEIHRADKDFAVLEHRGDFFQLHADHTYHDNPLLGTLDEILQRGGGIELRLYEEDPDGCEARAEKAGYTVLRTSLDRPHGLRECYLVDPDGYCWVPSVTLEV
jgi:catechol 2,3-dioxygenase-like lactoylglutathione lyase family enzyme